MRHAAAGSEGTHKLAIASETCVNTFRPITSTLTAVRARTLRLIDPLPSKASFAKNDCVKLVGRCGENRRRWPAKRLVPPRGARPGPPGWPNRNVAAALSAVQCGAYDAPLPG